MKRNTARMRLEAARSRTDACEVLAGQTVADNGLEKTLTGGSWVTYPCAVFVPGQPGGVQSDGQRVLQGDQRLIALPFGSPVAPGVSVRWAARRWRVEEVVTGLSPDDVELRLLMTPDTAEGS